MKKVLLLFLVTEVCSLFGTETEEVEGISWSYRIENDEAIVENYFDFGRSSYCETVIPVETAGAVTVPRTLGGCPVVCIGYNAFSGCGKVTSVEIPSSVREIRDSAFRYCRQLQAVDLSGSFVSIGANAFQACEALTLVKTSGGISSIGWDAFRDCIKLAKIELHPGLDEIMGHAFRGCVSLERIVLPKGLRAIGEMVFAECSGLLSIEIADGFVSIGYGAFWRCGNLQTVILPDSLTTLPPSAFSACESLTSVHLPIGLTEIPEGCFRGSGIGSVCLNESLTNIANSAFQDCKSLVEVSGGLNILAIGENAFNGCQALEKVPSFPKLQSVGGGAFCACRKLRDFDFNEGLTTVGSGAFSACESLRHVVLPTTLENMCWDAFDNSGVESLEINNAGLYRAKRQDTLSSLSSYYGDYGLHGGFHKLEKLKNILVNVRPQSPVFDVGAYIFSNTAITNLYLGAGVRHIGGRAIRGCRNLRHVVLPDSVETIGMNAFENCTSLESVTFGKSLRRVEAGAFAGCISLTNFTVSAGNETFYVQNGLLIDRFIEEVVACAQGCSPYVTIPDQVRRIKSEAFKNCGKIVRVYMRDSQVDYIGMRAFDGCDSLSTVVLPKNLRKIGAGAFSLESPCVGTLNGLCYVDGWLVGLENACATSVHLPDWISGLADGCFENPDCIQELSGGGNVRYVGDCGLQNSPWFGGLSTGIHYLGSSLVACADKTATVVEIPSGVTQIAPHAFESCGELSKVELPMSLTDIGNAAFAGCTSLLSVDLPDGVRSIGERAFCDCASMTNLNMNAGLECLYSQSLPRSLETLEFPDSVKILGRCVLNVPADWGRGTNECSCVKKLVIGDGIRDLFAYYDSEYLRDPRCADVFDLNLSASTHYGALRLVEECVFGKNLVAIPDFLFYDYCGSMRRIEFRTPTRIRRIGECAFKGNELLREVVLPEGVEELSKRAFSGCNAIEKLVLPASMLYIAEDSVTSDSMREVYVSDLNWWCANATWLYHANYELYCNERLVSELVWPSDLKSIGKNGLTGCASLRSVIIPDSVTSLGEYAFHNCTNLDLVVVGTGVNHIGARAFQSYNKRRELLKVVYLGNAPRVDPDSGFLDSAGNPLPSPYSEAASYVSEMSTGWGTGDSIPEWWADAPLYTYTPPWRFCTLTYDYGFKIEKQTVMVGTRLPKYLPEGSRVGYYFSGWEIVGSGGQMAEPRMVIGGDLTLKAIQTPQPYYVRFDAYGGQGVMSDQKIVYDQTNRLAACTFIREGFCFAGWSTKRGGTVDYMDGAEVCNLTDRYSITLYAVWKPEEDGPFESVVGDRTFYCQRENHAVTICACGSEPGASASLVIPDRLGGSPVVNIGPYAFAGMDVTTVVIPEGVVNIGERAFASLFNLTSITVPSTVVNIGEGAFMYCFQLSKITFPTSVKEIGHFAFEGCEALREIAVMGGNSRYYSEGGVLYDRQTESLVCCPGGFEGGLQVPEGVTEIGYAACELCTKLKSVKLPSSVTSLGFGAFFSCTNLATLAFDGNAPLVGERAFEGVQSNCTAIVRKGTFGWNVPIPGLWQGIQIVSAPDAGQYVLLLRGNSSVMMAMNCVQDQVYKLPNCTLTPPAGSRFAGWACSNGRRYDDGVLVFDLAKPGETMTMTAIWE